jgi:aminopeptidase N
MVRFDKSGVLLKEWTFEKSTEELLFQLRHDDVMGRIWAIGELQAQADDPTMQAALLDAIGSDPFWAVRERAIQAIRTKQSDAIVSALTTRARDDVHSHVRAAALESLGAFKDEMLADFFRNRKEVEESPLARASAATALAELANP